MLEGNFILMILVFFPFAMGLISWLTGRGSKKGRDVLIIIVTAIEMGLCIALIPFVSDGNDFHWHAFAGLGIHLRGDGFRTVMALIAGYVWFFTTILSPGYFNKIKSRNRNRYYMFMLWTLGATMGIFLSANLYTTFIFFEVMSFTSYVLVIHHETPKVIDASKSYVAFAVFGGLATLMGLFFLQARLGTLEMDAMIDAIQTTGTSDVTMMWSCALVLVGFAVKAGMFPLHTWLPRSYPAAPDPATALLSAVLSKAGIFGMFVLTGQILLHNLPWGLALVLFGIASALLGGIMGILSDDLKKTIACSSMSQIGFIITGIGMQGVLGHHNALAVRGSILHLLNHSLIKLTLFMVVAVIFMNIGKLKLNDVKGFGRKKPALMFAAGFAILGVIGVPLWNGYVSKTLIHESMVEFVEMSHGTGWAYGFKSLEVLFIIAGGMTCCYMLKIFFAVFVEKNNDPAKQAEFDANKKYMSPAVTVILIISAAILPVIGVIPNITADGIADIAQGFLHGHSPEHAVHYFSWVNISGTLKSLGGGVAAYLIIVRLGMRRKQADGKKAYIDAWPQKLDLEEKVYRPLLLTILPFVGAFVARTGASIIDWFVMFFKEVLFYRRGDRFTPPENNEFGTFNEEQRPSKIPHGLSYSLIMFGIGVVVVVYFIVIAFMAQH